LLCKAEANQDNSKQLVNGIEFSQLHEIMIKYIKFLNLNGQT